MTTVDENFEKRWKEMTEFAEVMAGFIDGIARASGIKIDTKADPKLVEGIKQVGNEFYKLGWADSNRAAWSGRYEAVNP